MAQATKKIRAKIRLFVEAGLGPRHLRADTAAAPAQVSKVIIDEAAGSMDVIVPDDQQSLAIGRRGQNVRLAVQLTGWKIDIKSESKMREVAAWLAEAVSVVEGCGEHEADLLLQQGITSLEDLAECPPDLLTSRARHCGSARWPT